MGWVVVVDEMAAECQYSAAQASTGEGFSPFTSRPGSTGRECVMREDEAGDGGRGGEEEEKKGLQAKQREGWDVRGKEKKKWQGVGRGRKKKDATCAWGLEPQNGLRAEVVGKTLVVKVLEDW